MFFRWVCFEVHLSSACQIMRETKWSCCWVMINVKTEGIEPSVEIPNSSKCMNKYGVVRKCFPNKRGQFINVSNVTKKERSCNQTEKLINVFMCMTLDETVKFYQRWIKRKYHQQWEEHVINAKSRCVFTFLMFIIPEAVIGVNAEQLQKVYHVLPTIHVGEMITCCDSHRGKKYVFLTLTAMSLQSCTCWIWTLVWQSNGLPNIHKIVKWHGILFLWSRVSSRCWKICSCELLCIRK